MMDSRNLVDASSTRLLATATGLSSALLRDLLNDIAQYLHRKHDVSRSSLTMMQNTGVKCLCAVPITLTHCDISSVPAL